MKRIIAYLVHRPEAVSLFILAIIILISRWFLLSSSLWHDDAFNFVNKALELAINGNYQNAHSTGYPLWTALLALVLKIGHWLTGKWSIVFLPNLLSAIFGALLVYPVFYLAKFVLRRYTWSLVATIIILFNPVVWNWSPVALSDMMSLFFALSAWALFFQFIKVKHINIFWWSNLCLYLALMNRLIYILLLPIFFLGIFLFRRWQRQEIGLFIFGWALTVGVTVFTYWLINNFSLNVLVSNYGSVLPNFQEIALTGFILLKSVGVFLFLAALLGGWHLYKQDRQMFYFLTGLVVIFWLYLSTWYRHGIFDLERYGLLFIVIFILLAAASLFGRKFTRYYFIFVVIITGLLTIIGLSKPLNTYYTYVNANNMLIPGFIAKAGQVSQHRLIDGDLQAYQDLATVIDDQQVVIHWQNDWSMPSLLLAGPQLTKRAELLSINSAEDLPVILQQHSGQRIYFLRGAGDAYQQMPGAKPLQQKLINNRSLIYYVDN